MDTLAEIDYDDPESAKEITAYDARNREKLDPEEVREGRAKELHELDAFEVKVEVDGSEMSIILGKKIWSKWVETRKDPASAAVRSRPLCYRGQHQRDEIRHVCSDTSAEIRAIHLELGSESPT